MVTSEQINEIAAACAKAQADLRPAVKDAVNPAFRSKYADHHAIVEAAKVFSTYGVAVFQDVTLTELGSAVVTRLAHSSGQWIEFGPLTVPLSKRDAHGVGSATTYAKRYALSAALGIAADEDDDGNAASQPQTGRPKVSVPALVVPATAPRPDAPDGYAYIERIEAQRKGNYEWADVTFGNGEIALAKGAQLIALLEQIAQEDVPVAVTTAKNKKGFSEIVDAVRWKPPHPAEPPSTPLDVKDIAF